VRPSDDVAAVGDRVDHSGTSRLDLGDDRVLEERGARRDGRKLLRELAARGVVPAALDDSSRGRIPERRRAAVAEDHLVAIRQRQKRAQAIANTADEVLHWSLPMARAEVPRVALKSLKLLRTHLGRPAAKAAVRRLDVLWNLNLCRAHRGLRKAKEMPRRAAYTPSLPGG
jgi:hypothetical protein